MSSPGKPADTPPDPSDAVAIALSASGQHSRTETVLIVLAVVAFINVISSRLWRPRQMRRKAAKALRMNSEG